MGHYVWKKDADGQTSMIPVDHEPGEQPGIKPVPLRQPEVNMKSGTKKVWECKICEGKAFPKAGLMAAHFSRMHNDLMVDKDTWRDYCETKEVKVDSDS